MEQKNSLTINLSIQDHKDLMTFCELNEIKLVEDFVRLCFRKGYYIEKYGLFNERFCRQTDYSLYLTGCTIFSLLICEEVGRPS